MDIKGRVANPTTLIVISMVLGVGAGIVGGSALVEVQFIGDIFFRLIQMCIVPFVMAICLVISLVIMIVNEQGGTAQLAQGGSVDLSTVGQAGGNMLSPLSLISFVLV